MKNLLLAFSLVLLLAPDRFKQQQMQYERVRTAYAQKYADLDKFLKNKGLAMTNLELYLRVFKQEQTLEIWAKKKEDTPFQLLLTYPFCAMSGTVGPKRREGDGQIPEGFYFIDRFNPKSNFYLSLGVNYPNAADKARNPTGKLGGDIFLHGDCQTVGCVSITDDKIKVLYVLAVEAFEQGQTQIPVHFFPVRFNTPAYTQLKSAYTQAPQLLAFWKNLEAGYQAFEQSKTVPSLLATPEGRYVME
ncbi:L,D-transpeptidase family protein [Nibribacter ruber]|uniref:L,D-transpeptidase family protein n=1 Tax=Nibribacter ruber TaxID=2698458 RepID=A0A6P1P480_9BACT|nr:L,D-transpeptidase family protein [Nibribacter ruber]QHL89191.1 L,D-transpeptidase family protein [Nibribacter ruber]